MQDPLFFHYIETNLILYVYHIKAYKIQPIRVVYMKPINLKFCAKFKIIYRNGGTLNLEKRVFDFSLLYPRKNSLKENQKCVHWILRLSHPLLYSCTLFILVFCILWYSIHSGSNAQPMDTISAASMSTRKKIPSHRNQSRVYSNISMLLVILI